LRIRGQTSDYFFTTARTLLSILRQSQALARLRFADEVDQVDRAQGPGV
jgi:DNA replicative helicase MCM subunit Mcm2 (Cdc46/Mcm family)